MRIRISQQIGLNWLFQTVDEIKALDTAKYSHVTLVSGADKTQYYYNATSVETPNDTTVLQPDVGAGRWLVQEASIQVNLISDLLAITTTYLPDGFFVKVLGYNVVGDGGGGDFYWSATSNVTPDNGTVFGTGPGQWLRLHNGILDVKEFGATGDGVTVDTAEWQAAVTYVTTNSALLTVSTGNYVLDETISSDAQNSKSVKIIGVGLVKIMWKGGNNDIVFDLRRWVNTCEFAYMIFENTDKSTNCAGIRVTCWTGSGTTTSGTVDMPWIHDIEMGQSGDLGFEYGIRFGDLTTYGSGEFFTYVQLERFFGRHCTHSIYIDATTFDLCQFNNINCNGGGSAAGGTDANATSHIKAITNVDNLIITGFNSNRCTDHAIDMNGGGFSIRGAWFENSGGAVIVAASGSSRPIVLDDIKCTSGVEDSNGFSIDYNGFGGISIINSEFDTHDVMIRAEQPLSTNSNNEFLNGATIVRNDNRFKRTYMRRPLGQAASHWERIELNYTDFDAASSSIIFDIPVADEPTSTVIHNVYAFFFTGFRGGAVSAATLDFGLDTDATGFFTGPNAYNTGAFRLEDPSDKGTLLWDSTNNYPKPYLMEGAQTLRATLQLTGGNGEDLTQGKVYIYVETSALYGAEEYYPEVFDAIAGSN